jgi:chemotaxis response regulator CheB
VLIGVASAESDTLLACILKMRRHYPALRIILYTERDYALTASLMQALDLGVQGLIFEAFTSTLSPLFLHELRRKLTTSKTEKKGSLPLVATTALARRRPTAIAIGASTGGPNALQSWCEAMRDNLPKVPIFITQHMPPHFTTALALQLTRALGRECLEPSSGEAVTNTSVFLAPGDWHMEIWGAPASVHLHTHAQQGYVKRPSAAVVMPLRSLIGYHPADYSSALMLTHRPLIYRGSGSMNLGPPSE